MGNVQTTQKEEQLYGKMPGIDPYYDLIMDE